MNCFQVFKLISFSLIIINSCLIIVTECENKGDSELNWIQYRNKCYYSSPYIESQFLSWQDADSFCRQEGGYLVSVHSVTEVQFINSKVKLY